MIIYVLNKDLDVIGLIEDYYSLTWAGRYYVCGDFELELPIIYDGSPLIEFGNFLYIASSDRLMIIEDIKPSTTADITNLVVKGESAESLLRRRVILDPVNLSGNAEALIYSLMTDHITSPTDLDRLISIFDDSFSTVPLTAVFAEQFDNIKTVYDIVTAICKNSEYGFKVTKDVLLGQNKLIFSVYEGEDRSYAQSTNPFVIFSDDFDNVISSSFYLSKKGMANTVYLYTKDTFVEGPSGAFYWASGDPEPVDLDRFETLLETEVESDLEGEPPLTVGDIIAILNTRAEVIIEDKKTVGVFEGEFDIQGNFKYGVDFFMGDIVQCKIEGRNIKARIIELVRSYSTEGETSYVAMDFIV